MTEEFLLTDSKLSDAIEDLIKEAKNELTLISPYIALSPRVKTALETQLNSNNIDFKVRVMFGKNSLDKLSSDKKTKDVKKLKESIEFLTRFPNTEIRFDSRLHAKFYYNDTHYIFTSMNLYDYSERVNIEFGILRKYSSSGLIGKGFDAIWQSTVEIAQNIKRKMLERKSIEENPIKIFEEIYSNADKVVFKSDANLVNSKSFGAKMAGAIGIERKIIDSENPQSIKIDDLTEMLNKNIKKPLNKEVEETVFTRKQTEKPRANLTNTNVITINKLASKLKLDKEVIINLFITEDYIIDKKTLTEVGLNAKFTIKKYMGNEYVEFPSNLEILSKLS